MKSLLLLLLLGIGFPSADQTDQVKHGKRFKGGRPMYSSITVDLNNDSTYYLSAWMHPVYSRNDTGTWFRTKKDQIILNSTVKTCLNPCWDTCKADYHFIHQKRGFRTVYLG
ncbi:MAG: hypothetical protein ACYC1Q_04675 [Bacteroidia bacterium]